MQKKKTNDRYKEEENVLASEGHSKHQIQIHIQQNTNIQKQKVLASVRASHRHPKHQHQQLVQLIEVAFSG